MSNSSFFILSTFQRHYLCDTVHPKGGNCTAGCAANQSEKLSLSLLSLLKVINLLLFLNADVYLCQH